MYVQGTPLEDNPQRRLIKYIIGFIMSVVMFFGLFALSYFLYNSFSSYGEDFVALISTGVVVLIALVFFFGFVLKFGISLYQLYFALKNKDNPDLNDLLRMKSIRRGIKRAMKKGFVVKDSRGFQLGYKK